MSDNPTPPPAEPRPQVGGYGGLSGYGKGSYGTPPPAGGMPYRRTEPAAQATFAQPERAPRSRLVGAPVYRRALAAVIDTLVVFIPAVLMYVLLDNVLYDGSCTKLTGFYGEEKLVDCSQFARFGVWAITILVFVAVAFIVEVGPTAGGRQSLGRRLAGVRAVDVPTGGGMGVPRASARFTFRTFISTILGIGFFWMIWDKQDRTLHDIVCRSTVVDH